MKKNVIALLFLLGTAGVQGAPVTPEQEFCSGIVGLTYFPTLGNWLARDIPPHMVRTVRVTFVDGVYQFLQD